MSDYAPASCPPTDGPVSAIGAVPWAAATAG